MGSTETPGANAAETVSRGRIEMLKGAASRRECGRNFPTFTFIINGLSGWRRERDSNPRDGFPPTHFPGVRLRPLGHLSSVSGLVGIAPSLQGPRWAYSVCS